MNASYVVNKQQSETWAEVACMMLVPGCQGIGKLTGGVQRIGTMQCGEPALLMMMIAFITIKSSLVPLIEGLCAQIYFRFEISVVCSHLLLFFFVKEKTC